MQEAANEGWSFRTLDRNINTQYFRRIVLCSETNGDVVRFSSLADNPQMYAAKYELYLPTQEELTREIERQKEINRLQQEN
jgi:predicted nuclease of restriction endonuclease-like (RecB) superfamily